MLRQWIRESPVTVIAGLATLISALMIMAGWYLEASSLVSPFGVGVSRFNTGFMFMLAGLLLLNFMHGRNKARLGLQIGLHLLLFLFAVTTLLQYITGENLGVDQLFIRDWMPAEQGKYPGRPSPATTLCFLFLSFALILAGCLTSARKSILQENTEGDTANSPMYLKGCLALYAALILPVAGVTSITFFIWVTGSADTILGRFSSGQSLFTCTLFMLISYALLADLFRMTDARIRLIWLPAATFSMALVIGGVIAVNSYDTRYQRYQQDKTDHLLLIKKLIFSQLNDSITQLSSLSWYVGDPLRYQQPVLQGSGRTLQGVTFVRQGGYREHFGKPMPKTLPECHDRPHSLNWINEKLLISVQAIRGNPAKDLCIHGLFDRKLIFSAPWASLNLKFDTQVSPTPLTGKASDHYSVNLAGRTFYIDLEPTRETRTTLQRDPTLLIMALSAGIGLLIALAARMLNLSQLHYIQINAANLRLTSLESRTRKILELAPEAVVLVDESGQIIYANQRCFEIFGHAPAALQDVPLEHLLPEALREQHLQHRSAYMQNPVSREMGENLSLEAQHADGHCFPVDIVLSPIDIDDEVVIMAIIRDISEKIAEKARIKQDLEEKEVLLKEVYHRVKNNMQVIASLLRMQSRSAEHPQTRNGLKEAALRISALALVHEKLYQSSSLARAGIKAYIESLTETLRQNYVGQQPLHIDLNLTDEEFEPEVIVPIGLILNELISNVLKHAFPEDRDTTENIIRIGFVPDDDSRFILSVEDNGQGIDDIAAVENSRSLGIKLIKSLVSQLKAKMKIESDSNGSHFIINIPIGSLQPDASPLETSGIKDRMSRR